MEAREVRKIMGENLTFGQAFDYICENPEGYIIVNGADPKNLRRSIYIKLPNINEGHSRVKVLCSACVEYPGGCMATVQPYKATQEDLLSHKWMILQ